MIQMDILSINQAGTMVFEANLDGVPGTTLVINDVYGLEPVRMADFVDPIIVHKVDPISPIPF